jgi:hypothetical protein
MDRPTFVGLHAAHTNPFLAQKVVEIDREQSNCTDGGG